MENAKGRGVLSGQHSATPVQLFLPTFFTGARDFHITSKNLLPLHYIHSIKPQK